MQIETVGVMTAITEDTEKETRMSFSAVSGDNRVSPAGETAMKNRDHRETRFSYFSVFVVSERRFPG
jgi:hypothetical protein